MQFGLFDRLLQVMAILAAAILAFVGLSVDFEIFMRYFLNKPTNWVIDFAEYSLLYCLFFSSAWVLSKNAHISIDILLSLCPPRVVRVFDLIASLIGAIACAVFFYASAIVTWEAYRASDVLWHSVIVPKWAVWIAMPIGAFLLTMQFVRRAWLCVRGHQPRPEGHT